MPRRIVTADGKSFRIVEYDLKPLESNEIRVAVTFAAPKHGTELHSLSGSAFDRKIWDKELRMFLPRPTDTPVANTAGLPVERGIGNMVVGTVQEIGSTVTRWKIGDTVFGYGQVREIVQGPEEAWFPLGNLVPESAVCVDPGHVAFVAVRDGKIRIGDTVAVYGLGAIGLAAVQIARAGGARKVFAVDPIAIRREFALAHGADAAFDPIATDAALEIKLATGKAGVDVSVETSGNARALQDAIRAIRQCGTVVHVPWGPKDCAPLHLDEEFHLNRPTLIGSQAWSGWGNPDRDYPLWNWERAFAATIELFRAGLVTGSGMVTPISHFEDAPEMLARAFAHPETAIKAGIRFP
jgi:threonine dehydrogenase-like Zn-dependent dehydrogenase